MTYLIRPATIADAAAICHIYNPYILDTVISFETEPVTAEQMCQRILDITANLPWLVCTEDDEILGYAYATKWRARAAYQHAVESSVYLSPLAAGKGLGSALYRALITELEKLPVHTVIGGIALPNAASVGLHEKMGYIKVAHFAQVGKKFDRWIDVGYWQRVLR